MNKVLFYLLTVFSTITLYAQFGPQQVISTDANGVRFVTSADLDGDGFIDVISASMNDSKIAWYKNLDGQGSFGNEQVIAIKTTEGNFTTRFIKR